MSYQVAGILNGTALEDQQLRTDGAYVASRLIAPTLASNGAHAAHLYTIAARFAGAPTGGGIEAWFEQIVSSSGGLPTSGTYPALGDTETYAAQAEVRTRLRGYRDGDRSLLPWGDWDQPAAIRYDQATDTTTWTVRRVILNVPHLLCLKGALTGGTSPKSHVVVSRVPLSAVPPRQNTDAAILWSSGAGGASTASVAGPAAGTFKTIHRIVARELSGAAGAYVDLNIRDGSASGAILAEFRVAPGKDVDIVLPEGREIRPTQTTAGPYIFAAPSASPAGTYRVTFHGRT